MKFFFINSSNIERDSFIWNMAGSLLWAFQSVIFLMILTRTVGLEESGIFTIAYANANLFLNIGKYGMHNYQVSDVKKEFSFQEYLLSRWITTVAMIIISVVYVVYTAHINQYSSDKTWIMAWMCLFKISDSMEDVYFADYQKKERLDIASKILTMRMILTILFFIMVVIITKDLLTTLIFTTVFTMSLMVLFIKWTKSEFYEEKVCDKKQIAELLKVCFPVFFSAFLSFYIGNAPKYAIDAQLTDELQACFGFIAMPIFVIGLLNGFIFNPILYHISCLWNQSKWNLFIKEVIRQIFIVCGITFLCVVGAYLLGIPVLSLLYNTDLSSYKTELLILLAGGGFLALSGVLSSVLTIMRMQNALAMGYGAVAFLAWLLSNEIVKKYEMIGAAVLYLGLMAILCVCFAFMLLIKIIKEKKYYN